MDDNIEKQSISDDKEAEAALQKKHFSMLSRLSKRQQPHSTNSQPSTESTSSFLSRFSKIKSTIESQLSKSQSISSDPSHLKSHFDKISESISNFENFVAQSSYFLPSYDVRSSLKTVSDLKRNLDNLNSKLIPKKKFSFKNKASKKNRDSVDSVVSESKQSIVPVSDSAELTFVAHDFHSPGFRNKTGEVLVGEFNESEIGELTISDLDSCEVRIIGCVRALFVHRLKDCRVYVGIIVIFEI